MKEQEGTRYLRYLGLEEERLQKRRASFISARNPARIIVVLVGVPLVLALSAIAYHAATGASEEAAPAAVSSPTEEQAGFISNASDGQATPAAVSSTQVFWYGTGSVPGDCSTCEKVAKFIGLLTYCLAQVFGVHQDYSYTSPAP